MVTDGASDLRATRTITDGDADGNGTVDGGGDRDGTADGNGTADDGGDGDGDGPGTTATAAAHAALFIAHASSTSYI